MRFLFVRPEICPWVSRFPTSGFLQICSHLQHPCLRLYPSHYRADSGLSPVRNVRRQAHVRKPLSLTVLPVMLRGFLCCLAYKPSPLMRIASGKRTLAIQAAPILCCHMLADGCCRLLYAVVCGWRLAAVVCCMQSSAAGGGCLRGCWLRLASVADG